MQKAHKYRIYPSKKQVRILESQFNECRWLYNKLLEERRDIWEKEQKSIGFIEQCRRVTQLKAKKPSLKQVHSQVLQDVAGRLDLAFQAFFRRIKQGEKPGYPRFKSKDRYHSITYPQFGFKIVDNQLHLAKVGDIKVNFHRPIAGKVKTCTITRKPTGKWYTCLSVKYESDPLPESEKVVGIDVGLESFATLSTGEKISNPRFFRTDEKALVKAQRKLSKLEKGTPERYKAKKVVARIHERIANRRHNFIHQEARKLVNNFGVIAVEKLNINGMMDNHCLAKSIADASWGQFINTLSTKAEEAGRKFVTVNPNNTSQLCSRCQLLVPKDLSTRIHSCHHCGLSIDRDLNSSFNILGLGLQSLGLAPRSSAL